MAIAYFIPDQSKLLRRSSEGSSEQNANMANNNTSAATSSSSSQPTRATATAAAATDDYNSSNSSSSSNGNTNNFRANITIPLNPFAPRHASNVGCWHLISQVFCYALRFYHESSSSSSSNNNSSTSSGPLIQITVEIRGAGTGSSTADSTQQQPPTPQVPPKGKN